MVKITYYQCDRCGKKIMHFKDVKLLTLTKKMKEFCNGCSEDFKQWYARKGVYKK